MADAMADQMRHQTELQISDLPTQLLPPAGTAISLAMLGR
jgi:hypothetical protein